MDLMDKARNNWGSTVSRSAFVLSRGPIWAAQKGVFQKPELSIAPGDVASSPKHCLAYGPVRVFFHERQEMFRKVVREHWNRTDASSEFWCDTPTRAFVLEFPLFKDEDYTVSHLPRSFVHWCRKPLFSTYHVRPSVSNTQNKIVNRKGSRSLVTLPAHGEGKYVRQIILQIHIKWQHEAQATFHMVHT